MELTEASATNLPMSGVLEFDYVSTAKAPPDAVPATDAQASGGRMTLLKNVSRSCSEAYLMWQAA